MRKIIVYATLLFLSTTSFSQQINPTHPSARQDYLTKSKHQKTAASILLGGGVALIGAGLLTGNREEASFDDASTGAIFSGIGALSAIGSIPIFIASGRNKRKAMNVSTSLDIRQNRVARLTGSTFRSVPCLSVKINI